ncbi:hypothetical protein MUK42_05034 [Musa troglodytarum]|uniref:Uncharacterized protein n=2 Tax=Musa troglodytarum TaxID=320322 RepID=A0A9E7JWP1_9LILI|nr:hypothetical protein MUK42_05034 [Musa troglodytarum]
MRVRASKVSPLSSIPNSNPALSLSPPSSFPPPIDSSGRCEGLDLLVLAAMEVFGDGALDSGCIRSNEVGKEDGRMERVEKREEELCGGVESGVKWKRKRRPLTMPARFQDSVLQPWKRRTRGRLSGTDRSG